MSSALEVCKRAVLEAGHHIHRNRESVGAIGAKEDRSLVTERDREAEEILIRTIHAAYPRHSLVAEERGLLPGSESGFVWYIDPIDGTHNFIRGLDSYGVSAGLVHDGEFVAGALYFPATEELYYGSPGEGAFKNGQPLRISSVSSLQECYLAFDSSFQHAPELMTRSIAALSSRVFNIRVTGSTTRTLAYLAEGKLDLSVEFTIKPWDFAGAVPILREAGAEFRNLTETNRPFSIESDAYVAGPPSLLDEFLEILARCREEDSSAHSA